MGKYLIYLGVVFLLFGLIWHFGGKWLPFGKLPGDFSWQKGNTKIHFPLASGLLVSFVLSLLLSIWNKWFR